MHRDFGLTSIIATHNLRLASACDRVLRLQERRLVPA
jgi:predicted ABC-type transport system involved in lysophospholipase L1 biosynthesis ATPase subunit